MCTKINYKHKLLSELNMYIEEFTTAAIGMHTSFDENSASSHNKSSFQNKSSLSESSLTQASRTINNYLSTPDKRNDANNRIRWINNLSYKRKKQLRQMKNQKPVTLPPLTKKIKKRLDLVKSKIYLWNKSTIEISKPNSQKNQNGNPDSLGVLQKIVLYDWLLQSCQGLKLSRTVFYMTISLLEKVSFLQKSNAQLVATSCLFLQNVMDDRCSRPIQHFSQITLGSVPCSVIKQYQVKILKDQNWIVPRISILDQIMIILQDWDEFVQNNPKLISVEKCERCLFLKGKKHVQNYIQFMAIIDSLKVIGIINDKNIKMIVFTLLTLLVGFELGYSTIQSIPFVKFQQYVPYKIVQDFMKNKFKANQNLISSQLIENISKKIYKTLSVVMGILIGSRQNVIQHAQEVNSGTVPKFEFLKQFYFDGMIPK